MTTRRKELAERLAKVQQRIAQARPQSGAEPELIVISKYFPASDVELLYELGVRSFGENREQEAGPKADATSALDIQWHFVGQLQTNKARNVVRFASAVHSVDRLGLVKALEKAKARFQRETDIPDPYGLRDKKLPVLLQIDLDPAAGEDPAKPRGGALPAELEELARAIEQTQWLTLKGVMAVAPLGMDSGEAFTRLAQLHEELLRDHPQATWRSAGMSHDLEAALAHGATHLRIGSDVLGPRPPLG